MAEFCPDCGRPPVLLAREGEGCVLFAYRKRDGFVNLLYADECRLTTIARLKAELAELEQAREEYTAMARRELAAVEKLKELCLERGRTPSLSNQVRLDEMCREMAIAHRDQEKP